MKPLIKRIAGAGAALAAAGAVAACGSSASSSSSPAASSAGFAATASMATSLATTRESWAIVPMSADPVFWQVFSRAANSAAWNLVTPPGVAINGGLVASADGASSLSVAVRPSANLTFSPLAATSDGGSTWSNGGPIDAAVAASPDAFAASGSNLAAVLSDGAVETSSNAGTSWSAVAKPGAIAASPAAKGCGGVVRITSVSLSPIRTGVIAGGTCGAPGTTALFSYSPGTGWQRESLPVSGQLVRLTGDTALVEGKAGLTALVAGALQSAPASWSASAALPVSGPVTASGTLSTGGAWVLLPGNRAATVSGAGQQWVLLPPVPAHTTVLASGPAGAVDALTVSGPSGAVLTVWRLLPGGAVWSKVQAINVPVQIGSSS
jgi:hypothetical protein